MPLLLRQSLRSSLNLTRTSRPIRPQLAPAGPSPFLSRKDPRQDFSVCLRCQFRARPPFYSSHETDRPNDDQAAAGRKDEVNPATEEPAKPEVHAEEQRAHSVPESENIQRYGHDLGRDPDAPENHGLPSSMENRRSQWSRQFTEMMDNVQSNIFVAGQRLNDLTGYSAIETLKRDIHAQGTRDCPCHPGER